MAVRPEAPQTQAMRRILVLITGLILLAVGPHALAGGKQQKNNQNQQEKQPQSSGQKVALKGLSRLQTQDVYRSVVQSVFFDLDYDMLQREDTARTESLDKFQWFQKVVDSGRKKVLLVGFATFATKPNRLVIWGQVTGGKAKDAPNPDVKKAVSEANAASKQVTQTNKKFAPRELDISTYQLSYISAKNALQTLATLGFNTSKPKKQVTLAQLPIVWQAPDSQPPTVPTGGDKTAMGGSTTSGQMNRLFILSHPESANEMNQLQKMLEDKIDVPARQVLIESMIVELTEEARRELGVQWDWSNRAGEVSGSFTTNSATGNTPLELTFDEYGTTGTGGIDKLVADLRALVKQDRAEILSTPSVLTTNNSQARIQVIRQVPILNQVVTGFQSVTKINVEYKDVGVMLNIKPRISKDGKMVTMQIRTEVSEAPEFVTVPVRGTDQPRKVAPIIARREVETIARVDNNTPFIIGGLIRKESNQVNDGLPVLRNIPLLGHLFEVKRNVTERREDIIVLTPRVIQPFGPKRPAQPKDTERFDFMNNELFRNSYRIKAEDVFDLGFIRENPEITSTIKKARDFLTAHPEKSDQPPFDEVKKNRLPGEQAVVVRMIYEIVKKLDLYKRVQLDNLIYFQKAPDEPAGYDVEFLKGKLNGSGVMKDDHFPAEFPRKVLVLRYNLRPQGELKQITGTPVAEAEVKEVSSEDEMQELWRKGNSLEGYHRPQSTVVIGSRDHLVRLKTALLVREILNVNPALLSVENFSVGRRITIPQFEEESDRIFLVDHNVSLYHFESEFYYAAFKNKLTRYVEGIQEVLSQYGR